MSNIRYSSAHLNIAAGKALVIDDALENHPLRVFSPVGLGSAQVESALAMFREAWSAELGMRARAAQDASKLLSNAARDTARIDELLTRAAASLGRA